MSHHVVSVLSIKFWLISVYLHQLCPVDILSLFLVGKIFLDLHSRIRSVFIKIITNKVSTNIQKKYIIMAELIINERVVFRIHIHNQL